MEDGGYVPYYLAAGHIIARDVAKGRVLTLADVLVPRETALFKLRQQQEALDWSHVLLQPQEEEEEEEVARL